MKTGQVVRVRVKEVDVARKRIALSMKSGDGEAKSTGGAFGGRMSASPPPQATSNRAAKAVNTSTQGAGGESALAAALRRAQEQGKR